MKRAKMVFVPAAMLMLFMAGVATPSQADPAIKSPAPAQEALTNLIERPDGALPPGTRLLGVNIRDGLATVDFNRALTDNFHGGDTEAAQAVDSILKTLGRFPTVSHVQILENGMTPGSLGGLIVLSSPLPVIRPQSASQP